MLYPHMNRTHDDFVRNIIEPQTIIPGRQFERNAKRSRQMDRIDKMKYI